MKKHLSSLALPVLSLLYIGRSPISPGTVASLVSLPIIYLFYLFLNPIFFILVLILVYFFSAHLITKYVNKPYDKSWIVMDEFIGMGITLLPLFYFHIFSLKYSIISFLVFRFFDIVKPSLIGKIDRLDTPSSVLLDDVLAGICSAALMYLITAIV